METKTFYANGKLLITGEYLVLQGALALAVPTVLGQKLSVGNGKLGSILNWKSYYRKDCWFEASFSIPEIKIINASDHKTASFLLNLLNEADKLNPSILRERGTLQVNTMLGFSPAWGLGSSSSLISNIADWFGIDPYTLLRNTQPGSGYDIACAKAAGPIRYRRVLGGPVIEKVNFNPPFNDQLAFVYSGQKQDSSTSVKEYLKSNRVADNINNRVSQIGRDISSSRDLNEFNALIDEHEDIIAEILQLPRIKERFPDFPGSIKSLGAWGGDFFLASSEIGVNEIKSYFSKKGLETCFSWQELILSNH